MKKILFVLMLMFSISAFAQDYSKEKSKSFVIAQDFVKKQFKHPKETTFEKLTVKHEHIKPYHCTVLGKVTGKNAYGIKTEYIYKIWLQYLGGEWAEIKNWKQEKIVLEEYK